MARDHADKQSNSPQQSPKSMPQAESVMGYPEQILYLQSVIGNQAVQRLIQRDEAETDSRARTMFQEGQALFESGDYAGAFQIFQQVVQMPDLPESRLPRLYYDMGRAMIHLNQLHSARSYLTTALQFAEQQNDMQAHERILHDLSNVRTRLGEDMADAPQTEAQQALAEASNAEARQLYQEAEAHFNNGEYQEALEKFQRVAGMSGVPENTHIMMLYNVGLIHSHMENHQLTIQYLEEFIQRTGAAGIEVPADAIVALSTAYARTDRGESDGSETESTETTDDDGEAHQLFLQAQHAYDAEKYGEAMSLFQRLYTMTDLPSRYRRIILRNLGMAEFRNGDTEAGLTHLRMYIAEFD